MKVDLGGEASLIRAGGLNEAVGESSCHALSFLEDSVDLMLQKVKRLTRGIPLANQLQDCERMRGGDVVEYAGRRVQVGVLVVALRDRTQHVAVATIGADASERVGGLDAPGEAQIFPGPGDGSLSALSIGGGLMLQPPQP